MHPHGDAEAAARAALAFAAIVRVSLELDGTVTGELRVGTFKAGLLGEELDPVARDLHTAVRTALDPRGILNPGKALSLPS